MCLTDPSDALLRARNASRSNRHQPHLHRHRRPPAEPAYPIIRVGMLSYLQYAAELKNRDGFNAFDLTRAYININAQLSRNVRFRFTPDIRRITDPTGSLGTSLVLRVKYGFMQLDNVGARAFVGPLRPPSDALARFRREHQPLPRARHRLFRARSVDSRVGRLRRQLLHAAPEAATARSMAASTTAKASPRSRPTSTRVSRDV